MVKVWGLKSGKDLKTLPPGFTWVGDVSMVEGMEVIYPVYRLLGQIPAIRNISNKLLVHLQMSTLENEGHAVDARKTEGTFTASRRPFDCQCTLRLV